MVTDPIATLHVLAQIAITLIGFTAIAVALKERDGRIWTKENEVQLDSIIMPPVLAIFLCFLPQLIFLGTLDSDLSWRLANAIAGLTRIANLLRFKFVVAKSIPLRPTQYAMMGTGTILVLANLLAAAAVLPWLELIFILGVLQPLAVGIHNFVLMVATRSSSEED